MLRGICLGKVDEWHSVVSGYDPFAKEMRSKRVAHPIVTFKECQLVK
jgi:hypothetical protein